MKCKILLIMLFGLLLGSKSFAQSPPCFDFSSIDCSGGTVCITQNDVYTHCAPYCTCSNIGPVCINITPGGNGVITQNCFPSGCGLLWDGTYISDAGGNWVPCASWTVTITGGCDYSNNIYDTWTVTPHYNGGCYSEPYTIDFVKGSTVRGIPVINFNLNEGLNYDGNSSADFTASLAWPCTCYYDDQGQLIQW